ncbi:hypothetical protein IM511_02585 [Erythrobacteraceae bacterium E2-1 Yellow Sea]|nr:hypothetical protein [Erythrobacteraceae bacterium E2-1 Yellow Sea]
MSTEVSVSETDTLEPVARVRLHQFRLISRLVTVGLLISCLQIHWTIKKFQFFATEVSAHDRFSCLAYKPVGIRISEKHSKLKITVTVHLILPPQPNCRSARPTVPFDTGIAAISWACCSTLYRGARGGAAAPYYGGPEGFELTWADVDAAAQALVEQLLGS